MTSEMVECLSTYGIPLPNGKIHSYNPINYDTKRGFSRESRYVFMNIFENMDMGIIMRKIPLISW